MWNWQSSSSLSYDYYHFYKVCLFSSVQSLSHVRHFATPWTTARQASLSITNSQSSPKFMSIESVMPSNHLILCHPLLLLPSIFPSIRVFSNESALCIRWPTYWSISLNISPSNDILLISCKAFGSTLSSHTIQMIMPPQSYTYWSSYAWAYERRYTAILLNGICLNTTCFPLDLYPLFKWTYI